MGLLDELSGQRGRPGFACGMGELLAQLTPEDRADLEAAMAGTYQGSAISRVLASRGHRISAFTIQRHRRGECRCGR